MSVLSTERRKALERACIRGRRAAEAASRAAIGTLGVLDERPPAHLSPGDRNLRRALHAKRDQLGDRREDIDRLVADCAYEQWHRLLFARFLAENNLLIHPQFGVQVTLAECDALAADLDEPDAWAVASNFAAEILPGIFRLDDPCVRLRLAPEGRLALEQIVESISPDTFAADDALGWVYQHWQKERKDEVNAAELKIGGPDLAPVTQLFTENYMVRFLLENSLGAWWASRHPKSPLVRDWDYLRVDDDGKPAAGAFELWPSVVAEVTVMDPCCGSGHFLVEAFDMLWRMRAEEQGLAPIAAQDAVLRENLFGLELDPRCVQIAMFAVAMSAWKAGSGWRQLPTPQIACSGIPVNASFEDWRALAAGDRSVESALGRLHTLFRDADILGSLIDPVRASTVSDAGSGQTSINDAEWEKVGPVLAGALIRERADPAASVLGADAVGLANAARLLSHRYTLVTTNVPYLGTQKLPDAVVAWLAAAYPTVYSDLSTVFVERCAELARDGSTAIVSPLGWLYLQYFSKFRRKALVSSAWNVMALLGKRAFDAITGDVVQVSLIVMSETGSGRVVALDATDSLGAATKSAVLRESPLVYLAQSEMRDSPDTLLSLRTGAVSRLGELVSSWQGLVTGDVARFIVHFWEVPERGSTWEYYVTAPRSTRPVEGRSSFLRWESGQGDLKGFPGAHNFNPSDALGRPGVLVAQMGDLHATIHHGELFNDKSVPLTPRDEALVPALWAFVSSPQFRLEVRRINKSMSVGNGYFLKIPFDREHWESVARAAYPTGLPEPPTTNDAAQWVFRGEPQLAAEPLQVAVARLLGYRWPDQADDDVVTLADADGIVCLPSVLGERTATDRLQELLARAFRGTWSPARAAELLAAAGSTKTDLDAWLRDEFFKAHCQLFKNRPFIWQIWDGRKDGFSALLNYHRLDRPTLDRVAYTYLGDWIERQTAAAREDVPGADERLGAARELQRKLDQIITGEPPFDIYVRWKPIAEQAIGWTPDIDDGVRCNVRPFVQAGVLRARFNVKWEKDRGKNADGSARHNNLHLASAAKQAARDAGPGA